jgi:hypothetical protein
MFSVLLKDLGRPLTVITLWDGMTVEPPIIQENAKVGIKTPNVLPACSPWYTALELVALEFMESIKSSTNMSVVVATPSALRRAIMNPLYKR